MKNAAGLIHLVQDLEAHKVFYEKLGFVIKKEVPGIATTMHLNDFWIEFLLQDKVVTEAFKEDIAISPKGAGQYLHIQVDNADTLHKDLLAKGLQPLSQPQDFPWGHHEFVLVDPAGYKLVFFNKLGEDKV